MNSSKTRFARFFFLGQSIASMFFIVYMMLPNISLPSHTPKSQMLSSRPHYSRNLSHLHLGKRNSSVRNKLKKKPRGLEEVVSSIFFRGRKKKTNRSNRGTFSEYGSNDAQHSIQREQKQLTEKEIKAFINSLELYPDMAHIRNIWLQVCRNEVNKFYDIINHFFTLYDEIRYRYNVKKDTFRKNIWEYFDEMAIKQLQNKENYFGRLINDLIKDKPLTKNELKVLTEQYKIACTELREELFGMCQIEIAQVMMQLPLWKNF
ncbi:Plasmodium exported protein, unknown function [Plasmodium knowlesi strain H]|uniref:Plasmodium RESA N-terminal domain-containing protein n=3 Tax=Plasmodium knowlesi TaxID=5850 RepID=A0A1A7W2U5_PLAKH|nr:Plasmodium exported protein (PHIST), unknown function [Plasmodium knowlesi strain H]OTN66701.1 Uncharacterized protein PKNOH_S08471900 [Plasmodium knowlesi]CAA9990044.1 Plasmodium exported protein (PHIST), unknown function [Plasmodium knowlesi strain H]SBO25699.1 Plasmodium exported protein, unknown function [Plasmodium knowlesi strain H]SBO28516.1 Plasmodium exported protein, unknown function [Plasmodium knowlesi strain H]VVS79518.1 Plasmodium exported protein (PHIST), unknown function [Pl